MPLPGFSMQPSFDCFGYVHKVVDGDTVSLRCDLGQSVWTGPNNYRLFGINTPELRGDDKEMGFAAKQHLIMLIEKYAMVNTNIGYQLFVKTHKRIRFNVDKTLAKTGKYGRYLIELLGRDQDGKPFDINGQMLRDGFAESYLG